MANKALPIVFLNLSGEMIYVIQQRLEAQNISKDKSSRVLQDIINTMFNEEFLEELFKPQELYPRSGLQSVFEKLVHSSIMRLNSTSMSKLYDLMMMVFKYQVVNCSYPEEILLVTLNHLDAIRECANPYPELVDKVDNVYLLLTITYRKMTRKEFEELTNTVVLFLHDLHIKVSVLIKLGYQHQNGELILKKNEHNLPMLNTDEEILLPSKDETSSTEEEYFKNFPEGSVEKFGFRGTTLGTNIYLCVLPNAESSQSNEFVNNEKDESKDKEIVPALEELNLLVRMMGQLAERNSADDIILSSIDDESEEIFKQEVHNENCAIVNIDASKKTKQDELNKISSDLFVEEKETIKSDLLELLDIAEHSEN